jgi:hypothetical protein
MTIRKVPGALCAVLLGFAGFACDANRPPDPAARTAAPAPSGRSVETTGKQAAALDAVPPAVLAAVHAARPELTVAEAEHEVRDGREYYDVAGTLPDGSELELDLMGRGGAWQVVEIQRDIAVDEVPDAVRSALPSGWQPRRIIESDQGEGVIIYEFFGPGEGGAELKREVRWADGSAELLEDEWMH